jgi:hypothetical protein
MRVTIRSKKFGDQTFFMPEQGGYVRLERGNNHGTLGQQICLGGGFRGNAISATPATFIETVRRWHLQRVRHSRCCI